MALGLIETRGLAGLIAATDAAVKAGYVEVRTVERATGGLVLVALVGDVASVQEAVAAGAQQAASVGHLVSSHVIPRPDAAIWRILGVPRLPEPRDGGASAPGGTPAADDLDALPVRELRRRARVQPGIALSGRAISSASKADLVAAIRAAARR